MTIRKLLFTGDSTTLGNTGGFRFSQGGRGSWVELVKTRLANVLGVGPLITDGVHTIALGFNAAGWATEWSLPASLTSVLSTDAYDKFPYTAGRRANGASKIWTWTKPAWMPALVGFALYYVDIGGNWQYRVDGGTWLNHNQASHTNQIVVFYVNTPITSTLEIRASSDASTGVDTFPFGIEPYYLAPSTTDGLIVHNIAVNGSQLHELCATTSGDRLAFLDSVVAGTGSPILPTPNAGSIVMHVNDVTLNNTTTWATDLTTFRNRAAPLGPVGFINIYEASPGFYVGQRLENYRDQMATSAAGFSPAVPVLNLYDALAELGYGGVDANAQAATVAVASDGVDIATFTGAGTLHTGDASSIPSTSSWVESLGSAQMIRYRGKSADDLTSCTLYSGSGPLSAGDIFALMQNSLIQLGGPFQMLMDRTHLDQAGHLFVASRAYGWVRNTILGVGTSPTTYPVAGRRADVAYSGKRADVAYASALPVTAI
ncbi:MAG TPA: hypothetical protein VLE97_07880 [Gaiellaceae bacterium]|nr:hypothetical protein [Gaiellaceae bacterium]